MTQSNISTHPFHHDSCQDVWSSSHQEPQLKLTSAFHYFFWEIFDELGHPKIRGMYSHPWYLVAIVASYLVLVLWVLPRFMKDRSPFDLKYIMRVYNLVNIIANAGLCFIIFWYTRFTFDCWFCKSNEDVPTPFFASSSSQGVLWAGEFYLGLKIFDLLDTIFFVLRKKSNQVTPLHVSHHAIMPFTSYAGIKFGFGPSCGMVVFLNSFVHTVMYYYYHLASMGQKVWWKKYITIIQLVQFYIAFLHATHTLFIPNCDYPRAMACLQAAEAIYFIVTFTSFYRRSYTSNGNQNGHLHQKKEFAKTEENNNSFLIEGDKEKDN